MSVMETQNERGHCSFELLRLRRCPASALLGGMLSASGRQYMLLAPWIVILPSTAIALSLLGLFLFRHAVRDIWVPYEDITN